MDIHEKVVDWEQNEGVDVLKEIGIEEGFIVADFGCGFGHYTRATSYVIGDTGKVYGIDINRNMIKYIESKIKEDDTKNIITDLTQGEYELKFEDSSVDCILFYDVLHGGNMDRFSLIKEAHRVLKKGGILSILPFHLSNFRDENSKKKKYKIEKIIDEISEAGFSLKSQVVDKGIHFEKYHSQHYIKQGGVDFDSLERGSIYNFIKI